MVTYTYFNNIITIIIIQPKNSSMHEFNLNFLLCLLCGFILFKNGKFLNYIGYLTNKRLNKMNFINRNMSAKFIRVKMKGHYWHKL